MDAAIRQLTITPDFTTANCSPDAATAYRDRCPTFGDVEAASYEVTGAGSTKTVTAWGTATSGIMRAIEARVEVPPPIFQWALFGAQRVDIAQRNGTPP